MKSKCGSWLYVNYWNKSVTWSLRKQVTPLVQKVIERKIITGTDTDRNLIAQAHLHVVYEDLQPIFVLFQKIIYWHNIKGHFTRNVHKYGKKKIKIYNYLKYFVTQISVAYVSIQICRVELGLILLAHDDYIFSTWVWNQPFSHTNHLTS